MIRINLSFQKKPAPFGKSGESGSQSPGDALKNIGATLGPGLLILLKTAGLPAVLCLAANFGYDYYIEQRQADMTQEIEKLDLQKNQINNELQSVKGVEKVVA